MSLNVNAQEFVPSFGSKSDNDNTKTKKKAKSSNPDHSQSYQNNENNQNNYNPSSNQYPIPMQQFQQSNGYAQYPSYPQQQYQPQTIQSNLNYSNYNPYMHNNNINNNNINNHYQYPLSQQISSKTASQQKNINNTNNKPKKLESEQQTEKLLKQQKEKQQKLMMMQRKATTKQLFALFPSISSSKLEKILKTHAHNLKRSILFVLQSKEFKGEFDKHVCVYHLSQSCQFEDTPSKCRYNHDREVPSAICQFWLSNNCIKNDQCPFLHRIPKSRVNFNSGKQMTDNGKNEANDPSFDIEELVLMLTAMFPQHKHVYLKKLLGMFSIYTISNK